MTFLTARTIHFTGIKGVGMTALAGMALDLNKQVTGSDTAEIFPTDAWLKTAKVKIRAGFSPKHLPKNLDLLVYTGAHNGADNPEVLAAKKAGRETINYAQALAQAAIGKKLLATAGVGGKTTTAALLATLLETAGNRPSWAVGAGGLMPLVRPGRYRRGPGWLVAETDEFVADPGRDLTPKFHYLSPKVAIITNLEHDHPDIYPAFVDVAAAFSAFAERLPEDGVIIANYDNSRLKDWLKTVDRPALTYGFSPLADWQIVRFHLAAEKQFFALRFRGMVYENLVLNLPGRYNLLNAAAAFAAGHYLGIDPEKLKLGLKAFAGTKRRFELVAETGGIRLYDDYAHHPTEISAVLSAARDWLPGRRLIVVFQPHTYSRTKALLAQFAASLAAADKVIVNEIFASARENDTLGISGEILAQKIRERHPSACFASGRAATLKRLAQWLRPGDAVFTLGAGNNWLWHRDIIKLARKV